MNLKNILAVFFLTLLLIACSKGGIPDDASLVYLTEIPEGQTGSEVCYNSDRSCIALSTTKVYDADQQFYGFLTPSCDSQVIREPSCVDSFHTEFAISNVVYTKSPNAESSAYITSDHLCLQSEKGKQGIYEYVYCVKK